MTMKESAAGVLLTVGVLMTTFAAMANAATTVLDPGPGTDYLGIWCGGQTENEIATGFDTAANAVTLVKVATTCHGSGRGSPNQYYLACWTVTFAQDGSIVSKVWLATNHWVQGNPAIPCPVPADPAVVYTHEDGAGNFPATLSTALIGSTYRAVLETTCTPINFGVTVSGTIGVPGAEGCYSFNGLAGDGVRVSVIETSGTLLAVQEVRRPDGTVLCSTASGSVDCALDATGLHTIVVHDGSGTATGGYDVTLTCLTPACGTGERVPHLTIGMAATLTPARFVKTLAYTITVGNDGGASAGDVVVQDTLPTGLFVRSLSSTQGTCSQVQQAVTCTVGSLAPSATVVVSITAVTVLGSGQVTNTACVETDNCATTVTNLPDGDAGPPQSR
jgi:uncharacterized repeat protein (TIGR01451 family)